MANNGCLGGFSCTRYMLFTINAIYIVVAFVLIGLAGYAKAVAFIVDYSVMGGIIACGVFLLIIASIGAIGTAMHHQATLFFYMIILFLLFIVQFIVACACLAVGPAQQKAMFKVGWQDTPGLRNTTQKQFDCCGCVNESRRDFVVNETMEYGHPPCILTSECCKNSNASCCTGIPRESETPGGNGTADHCPCQSCWTKVEHIVNNAIKVAGGVGLFFSFTEVLGVWLAYRFRNQKDPKADPSQFL
jgi:tetraspanin-13/31